MKNVCVYVHVCVYIGVCTCVYIHSVLFLRSMTSTDSQFNVKIYQVSLIPDILD